jgi:hypothetical protein
MDAAQQGSVETVDLQRASQKSSGLADNEQSKPILAPTRLDEHHGKTREHHNGGNRNQEAADHNPNEVSQT